MGKPSVEKEKNVDIPQGYSIAFTPVEKETVICEICGTENDIRRELCRVCSNYLEEKETKK